MVTKNTQKVAKEKHFLICSFNPVSHVLTDIAGKTFQTSSSVKQWIKDAMLHPHSLPDSILIVKVVGQYKKVTTTRLVDGSQEKTVVKDASKDVAAVKASDIVTHVNSKIL